MYEWIFFNILYVFNFVFYNFRITVLVSEAILI